MQLMGQFEAEPQGPLDTSCVEQIAPPHFLGS